MCPHNGGPLKGTRGVGGASVCGLVVAARTYQQTIDCRHSSNEITAQSLRPGCLSGRKRAPEPEKPGVNCNGADRPGGDEVPAKARVPGPTHPEIRAPLKKHSRKNKGHLIGRFFTFPLPSHRPFSPDISSIEFEDHCSAGEWMWGNARLKLGLKRLSARHCSVADFLARHTDSACGC